MKLIALAALGLALGATAAAGAPSGGIACFDRRPEPGSVRALRMTAHDEAGKTTILLLRLYGRRSPEGLGQLVLRVDQPEELRGTSLLMLQRPEDESEIYLGSPEQPTPRPIRGAERHQGMFATDFSYEDLQRVQHGWRPGAAEIAELPVAEVGGRPAYEIEVRPRDSVWERIVFSLDQANCLPLLIRFFESGRMNPRKELTTDPSAHVKHGDTWVAHFATMRDHVKNTTTTLMVDSHGQESLLPGADFTVEGLERVVRQGGNPAQ